MKILILGATGTIGRATARTLAARGHSVTAYGRRSPEIPDVEARIGPLKGLSCHGFDAVVSCLASRTGAPADAWAVDHDAQMAALTAAKAAGVGMFVLLSAICVQKPRLAFQKAKLAFEAKLTASGLDHVIVRPTAFFKSLSGQVARVKTGRPFLLLGDGRLTACKPISDNDLADYICDCLTDPSRRNRILPIGGPGPAITPRDQADALSAILKRPVRTRSAPVAVLDAAVFTLSAMGVMSRKFADKAEYARTGRYYATESMLVWDAAAGRYDADATPETGRETLFKFYEKLLSGEARVDLGAHSAFGEA